MSRRGGWAQQFLAQFRAPAMPDELNSGAEGGELLHPDQDNAPSLGLNPGDASEPPGRVVALGAADFRRAVGEVYPGDVRARAVADHFAAVLEGGQIAQHGPTLSPYQQQIIDTLILHLSRS